MDDEQLDKVLGGLAEGQVPTPDPDAKRRAIALARAEFVAAQATAEEKTTYSGQGFWQRLRLIIGNLTDTEKAMIPFNQTLMYTGVAAVFVGAVAITISVQYQPGTGVPAIPVVSEDKGAIVHRGELSAMPSLAQPAPASLEEVMVVAQQRVDASSKTEARTTPPRDVPAVARPKADMDYAAIPARVAANKLMAYPAAEGIAAPVGYQDVGRDSFEAFEQNKVKLVSEQPVSTFSVDVDTASYSFVRRMLNSGVLPQSDAVRVEELINYFDYDYALPQYKEVPFEPTVAISDAPWADGRKLMHIGIKGFDIPAQSTPSTNLVFLLDVSGSMNSPDKLPLVKQSMELLLSTLKPDDTVAIVVYAGAAGTVLEPTPVKERQKILSALRQLSAGGSTAGAQGIRLAYELAQSQFDEEAVNRVILATDGDFNVGISNRRELQSFIERQRESGIYLSVLGFGQGNYQDATMQTLAQNGNGVAAYIDTLSEAQKVLVDEATSTLFPIASDVKLQVEFNPSTVSEYRLIGYETRHLNREDFNNDAVDAGDIGAGHTVTAIYEFTPVGSYARQIEQSRYAPVPRVEIESEEYAFLKIRYKLPGEASSELITRPVIHADTIELGAGGIGAEAGFATAVAGFAQILKGGKYTGEYSYDDVIDLAQRTKGSDPFGYRTEFVQLVRKAKAAAAMQSR